MNLKMMGQRKERRMRIFETYWRKFFRLLYLKDFCRDLIKFIRRKSLKACSCCSENGHIEYLKEFDLYFVECVPTCSQNLRLILAKQEAIDIWTKYGFIGCTMPHAACVTIRGCPICVNDADNGGVYEDADGDEGYRWEAEVAMEGALPVNPFEVPNATI